ncbi:SpoIIE family protein phosphatase [Geobacter anodireducens]|uniref:Histidine kinase n=1 Tax=Geobacter soli TaxID=1510391 RepID=A0A0C1QL96_9BACT|nr:SpoIIE family protein phosphatase [Geobacter soli]KIE41382.1 histidine kinase [Geobacter soli]
MGIPLRVLIIEDSEDDMLLVLRELRKGGYEPDHVRVETAAEMVAAMAARDWDLALSDYVLPRFSGMDALRLWREREEDLPFIVVSGKIGEETAVAAMKAGANDYLIKGSTSRLVPAIARELQEAEVRRKRREAEQALARSEERYRRLVAAVSNYTYTVELAEGHVTRTSHGQGCLPVTGYTCDEYDTRPTLWYEMIHDEDRDRVLASIARLEARKGVVTLEHRIVRKDGEVRWVRNTIVPTWDDAGRLTAYDGLIADITERKEGELTRQIQTVALKAAANAIVICDPEGRIIWANPAFTRLTGYLLDEVAGRGIGILNSGVHGEEFYRDLWHTIRAGTVWHGEMINRRRDGSLYPEEQTITPVRDERGAIRCFIAIKQDIAERKQAQEALLENARLACDMQLARQIQRSLLPEIPPPVPGCRCAGRWVPAAHVGGDYYDFFPREDGSLDLVIADVSGHSVGAALIMTELRSVIRSLVHAGGTPARIVGSLNALLHEDLSRAELIITLFYASYSPATRTLAFASAGHSPPLVCRRRGECRQIDAEGLILGVHPLVEYEQQEIPMAAGDILLLYTDGITEATGPGGELFGTARLARAVEEEREREPEEFLDAILARLRMFTGGVPSGDDICMALLKVGD